MGIYDVDGYIDVDPWTSQYERDEIMLPLDDKQMTALPDKFDLRAEGGASPLKDKGKTPYGIGICWLFAGIASLESHLLYKKELSEADELQIKSELHGAYSTFDISSGESEYENPRGRKPGVKPDGTQAYGGNRYMAVNYLTRDVGATPHCVDPYYKTDMEKQLLPKRKWDITEKKPGNCYVKEVRYLPNPMPSGGDPNWQMQVKYHIMQYGGVACSILWNDQYVKAVGEEYSYFDNTSGSRSNHAVTIMGWDDTYPIANFVNAPKNPGAFLVKNCWKSEPAGGYFWISYESANFGRGGYCIAKTADDIYSNPYKILHHDFYGYNDFRIPYGNNKTSVAGKCIFALESGNQLAGVSFYACAACYADIFYEYQGQEKNIVRNIPCPGPGYYTYDLPQPLSLTGTTLSIIIKYKSATGIPAFLPLEIKDDENKYNHWNVKRGQSFVEDKDGGWVDVADLSSPTDALAYGNVCMKVILKNTSEEQKKIKTAYDSLEKPALYEGYTDLLTEEVEGEPVEWRLEPWQVSTYSHTYESKNCMYKITNDGKDRYGIVNIAGEEAEAWCVASVGNASVCMRKIIPITMKTVSKEYPFNCTLVAEHDNRTTLSGRFEIPGAKVCVSANGQKKDSVVKEDKTWEIRDFSLYDATGGWSEDYKETKVTVQIQSSDEYLLTEGSKQITLVNPVEKHGDGWLVWTLAGIAAAAYIGGCIYLARDITVGATGAGGAIAGAGGSNVSLKGLDGRRTIEAEEMQPLLGEAKDVDGVIRRFPNKAHTKALSPAARLAGLVGKISKGGSVTDCHVTGYIDNAANLGGLFYEGEDVTVKDCTVEIEADNCTGIYAGVAANLKGDKNTISDVTVEGKVNAGKISGLVDTMEGGSVKNVGVSLSAQGQTAVAGLIGCATGVQVSGAVVSGSYQAAEETAVGVVGSMKGGSITNCRVSALLSGGKGAYGVVGTMESGAGVSGCYSACCLTATEKDGEVCGIGKGVSGASGSISGCVSVGSHFAGAKSARISLQPVQNCVAYDSMTCDGKFIDAGEVLKAADAFLDKSLYEQLGWDLSVWKIDERGRFPLLQDGKIAQKYDYPFPFPEPPKDNRFVYDVGQTVAIMGMNHERTERLTWSLSPHLAQVVLKSGEVLEKGNDFYLQLVAFAEAGTYDLVLIGVLDGHRYNMPILLEIKEKNDVNSN